MMAEDPSCEKSYLPFIVNTGLSYFPDTIEYANQMNMNGHLDNKLQYSYLINIIRPKKRFSKWAKKVDDESIDAVMKYFGYNRNKAKDAIRILSPEQIEEIKEKNNGGGV
jgi:hypothetical protein